MVRFGRRRLSRWSVLALAALAVTSCDDSGTESEPTPAIGITLSVTSLSVAQGGTGSVNVTLSRQNGFAEAVAVTVEGLPTGVTVPALSLPAGQTTGTLTFTAAAAATAGTTTLTVRATGPGVTAATATLSLVVQAVQSGFTMSVAPATLTVQQGGSTTTTLTVARTGTFTGVVNVAVTGLPAGVTPTFNPTSVTGTTTQLTLAASSTATTGAATVTVTGSATGVPNQTATIALTVSAAPVTGTITLSITPAVLSVQQGGTATTTVTVGRTGTFTGPVSLTATGLPTGVTATFNPPSVTGTTSQLTLNATATAPLGAATITVTGGGTGVSNVTSTVALTVTTSGGGAGNVSISFCPLIGNPLWVAFQDGSQAPWVRSTAVNGVFSGQISSGRGGVAYVTAQTGGGFVTNVFYGTTAELQGFSTSNCFGSTGPGKTVNVTVAGVGATEAASLALGTALLQVQGGLPAPTAFQGVPDGTVDLLGARGTFSLTTGLTLNRLFAQRGINPAAGSTVNVDFNGANSLAPVPATVTINNIGADQALVQIYYRTANQSQLFFGDLPSTSTSRNIGGFPTVAGSFHQVGVIALGGGQVPDRARGVQIINAAMANRVITLPSELGTVTVTTAATTPTLRLTAQIPSSQYNSQWNISFSQGSGASSRTTVITASNGFFVTPPTTVTLSVPDLSGTAGYDINWGLANTTTNWQAFGFSQSGFGTQGQWQENAMTTFAYRTGTFSTEEEQAAKHERD